MTLSIYHNPRCSKSRQTLELLQSNGHEPEIIDYLKTPPDSTTLGAIITALGVAPINIMRTNEDEYITAREEVDAMNEMEQLRWLATNIRVMQRPIVVNGNRARIGRPPESVLNILD